MDAGGIHEHDLPARHVLDRHDPIACRLRLVGHDGELGPFIRFSSVDFPRWGGRSAKRGPLRHQARLLFFSPPAGPNEADAMDASRSASRTSTVMPSSSNR